MGHTISTPTIENKLESPMFINATRERIYSIDFIRGYAMILMALDHVREAFYYFPTALLNSEQIPVSLYFTRWLTHFCAPTFIFLAGTGTFLSLRRGNTKGQTQVFLITRGFWLIFLDLIVINSSFDFHHIGLGVIWALGWSMIVLGLIMRLPLPLITITAITIIGTTNLCISMLIGSLKTNWAFILLLNGGSVEWISGFSLKTTYPLVPWAALMALGYTCGNIFLLDAKRRSRMLVQLGILLVLLFITLRYVNVYGDPMPWNIENSFKSTILSFLNCEKYPPALLFLLMTMGPVLFLLGTVERKGLQKERWVTIFGKVPLFFYLLHLPLIRVFSIIAKKLFLNPYERGFSLPVVYFAWISIVLILFPLCVWYNRIKSRYKLKILRYI